MRGSVQTLPKSALTILRHARPGWSYHVFSDGLTIIDHYIVGSEYCIIGANGNIRAAVWNILPNSNASPAPELVPSRVEAKTKKHEAMTSELPVCSNIVADQFVRHAASKAEALLSVAKPILYYHHLVWCIQWRLFHCAVALCVAWGTCCYVLQMAPDDPSWLQMAPNGSRLHQMSPDRSRWFQMAPDDDSQSHK